TRFSRDWSSDVCSSDLALLASVRAGEVALQLVAARQAAALAHARLAVLLGAPADSAFMLPAQLPDTAAIARLTFPIDSPALVPRSDDRRGGKESRYSAV